MPVDLTQPAPSTVPRLVCTPITYCPSARAGTRNFGRLLSRQLPARLGRVRGRYARTANKQYSADPAALTDFETHFTVVCYEDDSALAASQVCPRMRLCACSRRNLASDL